MTRPKSTNDDFVPAIAIPVGEYIQDELDARGWSRADLAGRTGFSETEIGDVIDNKVLFTGNHAERIALAFGTNVQTWMNINHAYRRAVKAGRSH